MSNVINPKNWSAQTFKSDHTIGNIHVEFCTRFLENTLGAACSVCGIPHAPEKSLSLSRETSTCLDGVVARFQLQFMPFVHANRRPRFVQDPNGIIGRVTNVHVMPDEKEVKSRRLPINIYIYICMIKCISLNSYGRKTWNHRYAWGGGVYDTSFWKIHSVHPRFEHRIPPLRQSGDSETIAPRQLCTPNGDVVSRGNIRYNSHTGHSWFRWSRMKHTYCTGRVRYDLCSDRGGRLLGT